VIWDGLPTQARSAVAEALTAYAVTGNGDVKKLGGREGYRMRVGSYRVLFAEDATTILAIHIGRRTTTTYRR
jgi:mRNA interferase RelE/StbE